MPTLTSVGEWFRPDDVGKIVTMHDGRHVRISYVHGPALVTIEPVSPGRWERLWLYLTTAPNGDATRWMS